MARILGLDISTHVGIAVLDDGKINTIYTEHTSPKGHGDFDYLDTAYEWSVKLGLLLNKFKPDTIAIEQTNQGQFKTQKLLEFLHMITLMQIDVLGYRSKTVYIPSSLWRSKLKIRMTKEDRAHNKLVKAKKAKKKLTFKHMSVRWANETFGLQLLMKDNDIADAIAICVCAELLKKDKPAEINLQEALR